MTRWGATLALTWVLWLVATPALAFCGFFVTGGQQVSNDASQVALMRVGTRTVLSMRNSYAGPPEDFALVVPVPVVLQEGQVRTLSPQVLDRLDQLTGPRLVEYWEQDPCPEALEIVEEADNKEGGTGTRAKGEEGSMGAPKRPLVRIEAQYSVDEYDIVILSADDSTALEVWLGDNGYKMPPGIEPYLRPYVMAGSKFFVAKVDVKRVRFLWGRAVLSPLRFHYDSEQFALPIRLGLVNATGPQDLVVYVLAPDSRYDTANYDNVFAPSNLEVDNEVRSQFPSFYASLFDRAVAGKPRAVVTEYAWDAGSCDPCPVPPLDDQAIRELGGDVLEVAADAMVITRLHARYSRDTAGDDLVFRKAPPLRGGRDGDAAGGAEVGASSNNFQARYIIHHPWKGPVSCSDPAFGMWGGPPNGERLPPPPTTSARVRRDLPLDRLVLAAPVSGAGAARTGWPEHEPPSLLERWVARGLRWLSSRHGAWGLLGAYLIGLLVVVAVARKQGQSAVRHALSFAVIGVAPAALLLGHRSEQTLRELPLRYLWPVLYVFSTCAVVCALMLSRQGRAYRRWLPALLAMLPAAAGLALYRFGFSEAAPLQHVIEPAYWPQVAAVMEAEALQAVVIGACGSALLLLLAATNVAPSGGTRRPGRSAPLLVGLVALPILVALVLAGERGLVVEPFRDGWPMLLFVPLLVVSAWLGRRAARSWPEQRDARPAHVSASWVTATWLATAAGLVALALAVNVYRMGLDATGGRSVDPSQIARILYDTFNTVRTLAWRAPLWVLCVIAPWLVVLRGWRREAPLGLDTHGTIRAIAPIAACAALVGLYVQSQSVVDALHHAPVYTPQRLTPANVALPPLCDQCDTSRMGTSLAGPALFVGSDGVLMASATSAEEPRPWQTDSYGLLGQADEPEARPEPLLFGDRSLRVKQLREALDPILSRQQPWFRWVFGTLVAPRLDGPFGRYRDMVVDEARARTFDVEWVGKLVMGTPAQRGLPVAAVALRPQGDELQLLELSGAHGRYRAIEVPTSVRRHELANRLPSGMGSRVAELVLCLSPDTALADIASLLMAALEDGGRDGGPAPRVVLTTDEFAFAGPFAPSNTW